MAELYIPKRGELVRIVEVADFDHDPEHKVGDEVDVWCARVSEQFPDWIVLDAGTFCRVEPIERGPNAD